MKTSHKSRTKKVKQNELQNFFGINFIFAPGECVCELFSISNANLLSLWCEKSR